MELPILQNLDAKGVALVTLQELPIPPPGLNQEARGNFVLGRLGMAFRRWCKERKLERPPAVWNLNLIGRGEGEKNSYPTLDSNVKAIHTKLVLFFLSHVATEISNSCGCT